MYPVSFTRLPLEYKIDKEGTLYGLCPQGYEPIIRSAWIPKSWSLINQWFGNEAPLYTSMGLLGHNGLDWKAVDGQMTYYPLDVDGVVTNLNPNIGIITIELPEITIGDKKIKARYRQIHLMRFYVKVGDTVTNGQLLGLADNKGYPIYSTGSHLHDDLSILENGVYIKNGYGGCIDHSKLFTLDDPFTIYYKPMQYLKTQKEIVDYYIRKGIVLGVSEDDFKKIEKGDQKLIDRIKKNNFGMFFRSQANGEFYILE